MTALPGRPASLWIETAPPPRGPASRGMLASPRVDVAVIGAGIAGLTAASLLKAAGRGWR
jgi:NADPH-dependent 2,4-dienoyl-CoA reductase/sulfur reductase-like enzyme